MKYKYLRKITAIFLFSVLTFCFSVISVGALDNKLGSITVNVNPGADGIELKLYEVADYINGKYTLNKNFSSCSVDLSDLQDAKKAQVASQALESHAVSNNLDGITTAINSDGKAVFTSLSSDKLYLVAPASISQSSYYVIQPLLACVPYMKDNTEIYDVSVNAKFYNNQEYLQSAVILNKCDDNNARLSGAVFSFQSKNYYTNDSEVPTNAEKGSDKDGNYYWKSFSSDLVTNANGQIVVERLPFGTYRFIEIQAPLGYQLDSTPHEFTLSSYGSVKTENNLYILNDGKIAELTVINKSIPTPPPSEPSDPVKTSDDSNLMPYIIMFSIAGVLIFGAVMSLSLRKRT